MIDKQTDEKFYSKYPHTPGIDYALDVTVVPALTADLLAAHNVPKNFTG